MCEPTDAEVDAAFTAAMRHVFGAQFNPTFGEAESARPQWRAALKAAHEARNKKPAAEHTKRKGW